MLIQKDIHNHKLIAINFNVSALFEPNSNSFFSVSVFPDFTGVYWDYSQV